MIITLAMRIASTPSANVSYLLLAVYALLGRTQAIQALALSWLFTMLSPGITANATMGALGRYAVLAGAAASVLARSDLARGAARVNRMTLATILLGAGLCIHSILFSPMKDVSLLKAISWTCACSTLIAAWAGLSLPARRRLEHQIFGGLALLVLLSLPLVGAGLGYLRNGTGFQGLMNHPQAFGPTVAVLAAWTAARILTNPRPPLGLISLFGICLLLIVLSEARTAGFALLLALGASVGATRVLTGKSVTGLFPALRNRRSHVVFAVALAAAILAAPALSTHIQEYVSKRGESTNVVEAYDRSRGRLMDQMISNIQKEPWTGIGFGIASDPQDMEVSRDPVLGLPVGASIEKGVLPLAVLEELGVFGAATVLVWIGMIALRGVRGLSLVPLALLFTALLLNMGEMMLFSAGGMGLLMLVMVGFAASERAGASGERREYARG